MRALATIQSIVLAVLVTVARAEPPVSEQDYGDDKLLAKATQEIAQMNSDQLDAFIEYIANCRSFDSTAMSSRLHCAVALKRSEIKNSGANAVMRIARVVEFHAQAFADGYSKPLTPARARHRIDANDGEADRFRDIFENFELAAAARYTQLHVAWPK